MEPRTFSIELTPEELSHLILAVSKHNIECNFAYINNDIDYCALKTTFDLLNKIKDLQK